MDRPCEAMGTHFAMGQAGRSVGDAVQLLDGKTRSPVSVVRELKQDTSAVGYHFKVLRDLGAIELVGTRPVRGVIEHLDTARWRVRVEMAELPNVNAAKVASHPLRLAILGAMDGEARSPGWLANELGETLGDVSYHVNTLRKPGAIERAGSTRFAAQPGLCTGRGTRCGSRPSRSTSAHRAGIAPA